MKQGNNITLLLALQSYKITATYGNPCALFATLSQQIFNMRNLNNISFMVTTQYPF